MLGAVGAYDWNGTVLMVKDSGISMPTNDTFRDRLSEKNEPLAAYLGKRNSASYNTFQQMLQDLGQISFTRSDLQNIILHSRSLGKFIMYGHVHCMFFLFFFLKKYYVRNQKTSPNTYRPKYI